ncbi:unnamed protein product [Fraxinus pennsylvanica]|uniref:H(+)-exporting diphosphatase n=1 Tax=Fraxinus pennsylvanica TaxID=56036 RepID=A0AAD1YWN9_9LAMI|nr:unnamed protein product [Fraxinus pennsylvanica]
MALFGRVRGCVYTKAADVDANLVVKNESNILEDDPRNPTIRYNAFLMSQPSCTTLVVASISSLRLTHDFTAMCYRLLISSIIILVCLITTLFASEFFEIKVVKEIEPRLKNPLIISIVLMTMGIAIVTWHCTYPSQFSFGAQTVVKNW